MVIRRRWGRAARGDRSAVIDHGSGAATRCCDPRRLPRRRAQIGLACRAIGGTLRAANIAGPGHERHPVAVQVRGSRNNFGRNFGDGVSPNHPAAFCYPVVCVLSPMAR
jgi:hypothetical protein